MGKVAGYVRVSTEKQKKDESHKHQKQELEEWAERNSHEIEVFEDIAISGQKMERESFDKLMNSLNGYDIIAVRELSRLSRSLKSTLHIIDQIEEEGLDFVSLKENIDTNTAQGKLFFHIVAAFNQYWADLARERTQEMIEKRKREGKLVGRPRKLSDEQIQEAIHLFDEANLSYSDIARLFRDKYEFNELHRSTIKRNYEKFKEG